jgi:GntR family transcriptional regulator/MocR family aminotransferase
MRNKYRKKRNDILSLLTESPLYPLVHIKEENAGLHFLLEIKQDYDYDHFISSCHAKGLHIKTLKDYGGKDDKTLIINYSSLPLASFKEAITILYDVLKKL